MRYKLVPTPKNTGSHIDAVNPTCQLCCFTEHVGIDNFCRFREAHILNLEDNCANQIPLMHWVVGKCELSINIKVL